MKFYVAGSSGLVGSSVLRALNHKFSIPQKFGRIEIITRTRTELDLTRQEAVEDFFKQEKPDIVILCAAKVGGIIANFELGGDFIRENLLIQNNVIESARRFGCEKFCFLGSSCIYPRLCLQPIKEEYLLTSDLETTNRPYAISKIAGLEMIRAYNKQYDFHGYCLMPTNLYGPNDTFDPNHSHALPGLIRRFHEAKINDSKNVIVWGNGGVARREFLFAPDLGRIIVDTLFMDNLPDVMNVGVGEDISINDLALLIKKVVGFEGEIQYDKSKPDGTPRKLLDVSKMMALGLKAETKLEDGIRETYEWFVRNKAN